jgi:hypothetical protein
MKIRILRTLLLSALAVVALSVTAAAQNVHAGGQSGSVTQNSLIKSVGPNQIASTNVSDDGAKVTVAGPFALSTTTALTAGSTVSVNPTLGNVFTLTPGEDETINAASCTAGQRLNIIVTTTGTTSRTLTFSTRFKVTGTLATGTTSGKVFVIEFIGDGTNYNEVSRTTAM